MENPSDEEHPVFSVEIVVEKVFIDSNYFHFHKLKPKEEKLNWQSHNEQNYPGIEIIIEDASNE
jgi:hypothetical protein